MPWMNEDCLRLIESKRMCQSQILALFPAFGNPDKLPTLLLPSVAAYGHPLEMHITVF